MSNIETSHQQTFTYTAQATTTVVTEVETPPARWHFPRIKTGFDHTYLRSIEGILRIISVPAVVLFFILTVADYRSGGEWYSATLCIWWIFYAVITFAIELLLQGIYVHRLIDGVICLIYAGLFVLADLIAIIDASRFKSVVLGVSAIFGVAATILIALNAVFALRTWRTHENGRKGSVAIFFI